MMPRPTSRNWYNEIDPYAAEMLRNLIKAGEIAPGDVDERDIRDVRPSDLDGYTQCHFFAGIGVWPLALRYAGWSPDRPVWTGSCPCQPFSAAGQGEGFDDERHLWPAWFWLISQCKPATVLGEQVASKDGLGWFDLVSSDMESAGYAIGTADLCAAGIGVAWPESQAGQWLRRAIRDCDDPLLAAELGDFADYADRAFGVGGNHIRQRLYFGAVRLAEPNEIERRRGPTNAGGVANRAAGERDQGDSDAPRSSNRGPVRSQRPDAHNSGRRDSDWLLCTDGSLRPVEPGTFPLAAKTAARMDRLRAYGNGLDLETATAFVRALDNIGNNG